MRFLGVNIPDNKKIKIALTYIYGIGVSLAYQALKAVKIDPELRTNQLDSSQISRLKEYIEKNYRIEGALRQEIRQNIERLKRINCYRGIRHIKHLPVRGQRTRTNSRTVRGNVRRTVGSGRRKIELK